MNGTPKKQAAVQDNIQHMSVKEPISRMYSKFSVIDSFLKTATLTNFTTG